MDIKDGDVFSLIRLGNTLVGTRKRFVTPEVAGAIEALMQEQGVTLKDPLDGLEKRRQTYVRERYGIGA